MESIEPSDAPSSARSEDQSDAPPPRERSGGRWLWLALVAVLLVAAMGGGAYFWYAARHAAKPAPVVAAAPGTVEVILMGAVAPRGAVPVPAPVDGVLQSTDIPLGGEVLMGQIIGRLVNEKLSADSSSVEEQITSAHERIGTLESQLASARLEATRAGAEASASESAVERTKAAAIRQELLYREGATARNSYEAAQKEAASAAADYSLLKEAARTATERATAVASDLERAQKSIDALNTALAEAGENLRKGEVMSPIDGVLVGVRYLVGDKVPPGTTDLYLVAPNSLSLAVALEPNPELAPKLQEGMPAEVTLSSHPELPILGHLAKDAAGMWQAQFDTNEPLWKAGDEATVRLRLPGAR